MPPKNRDKKNATDIKAEATGPTDAVVEKPVAGKQPADSAQPGFSFEPMDFPEENTQQIGDMKINWEPNAFADDFLDSTPKESNAEPVDDENIEEPTEEEKRKFLAGEFDAPETQMTLEELMEVAYIVIDLLDAVNSTAVGAFAGEKSSKFELDSVKRKTLAGFLAKVFFKYQVKMGPVAGLVFAMLLYFGLTWKAGYEIRRDKKIEADRAASEAQKAKNKAKIEAFQNKIIATLGVERLALKTLAERMGMKEDVIKPELQVMMNVGTVKVDHSTPPARYSIAS